MSVTETAGITVGASALRIAETLAEAQEALLQARENAQDLIEHAQRDLPFLRFHNAVMLQAQHIIDDIPAERALDDLVKQSNELLELLQYATRKDV